MVVINCEEGLSHRVEIVLKFCFQGLVELLNIFSDFLGPQGAR